MSIGIPLIGTSLVMQGGVVEPPSGNLIGWYEADNGITKSGNDISQWNDKSGNGNHMTNTGATNTKPQLLTDTSGDPSVTFLANRAGLLDIPSGVSVDTRDCSMFVIANRDVDKSSGGYDEQMYLIGLGSAAAQIGIQHGQGAGNFIQGFGTGELSTTIKNQNMYSLYGIVSSSSSTIIHQNGQSGTTTPQVTSATGITGGRLGNHGSVTSLEWPGAVRAVLIYDKPVDASELSQIKAWAVAKYRTGRTNTIQLAFAGDSITAGTGASDPVGAADSYPQQVGRLRDWDFDGINSGFPGVGVVQANTEDTADLDPAYNATIYTDGNICCVMVGGNDLAVGTAEATVFTNLQTYVSNRKSAGWTVLVGTIMPRQDITAGEETARVSMNADIVTNTGSWHDGVMDFAAHANLDDETDTTYFDTDRVHLTAAGYGVMAGVANTAITAALP